MKKYFVLLLTLMLSFGSMSIEAETELKIVYNGVLLAFDESPVIINDKTLVQLRPIAEAMNLEIGFENGEVSLSDEKTSVVFTLESETVKLNGEEKNMGVPMVMKNDYTFVPARELAEPFGNLVEYDGETKTVIITSDEITNDEEIAEDVVDNEVNETEEAEEKELKRPLKNEEPLKCKEISTGSGEYESCFFYQSQPEIGFEENGRGYCWVCAYSMIFSNVSENVITPLDIAQYNIDAGYGGSFMAGHSTLADYFGLKLVPALLEESPYYEGFDTRNKGETTLLVETDEDAFLAIKEALDNFPCGVIVRYDGYPHSMVAVSYDDENIYFNDPGLKDGEHVTFDKTCLTNFNLSDISFIQAVEVK